jgi:hypothetical protein
MLHVIHDTRISSGQCPRRDVTVRYGLQGHMEYTSREKTYTCQLVPDTTVNLGFGEGQKGVRKKFVRN